MVLKKGWFLRYVGVELRDGSNFVRRSGVGVNVEVRGGGVSTTAMKKLVGNTYSRVVDKKSYSTFGQVGGGVICLQSLHLAANLSQQPLSYLVQL